MKSTRLNQDQVSPTKIIFLEAQIDQNIAMTASVYQQWLEHSWKKMNHNFLQTN